MARKFVLALAVVCFAASCVEGVNQAQKRNKLDRIWKGVRKTCLTDTCSHIHPDEDDNCVNNCTSPVCYEKVYGASPLEPGEIHYTKWRDFTRCARQEADEFTRKKREESYKTRYAKRTGSE